MKKKMICWLLALLLVLSCAPTALAADDSQRQQRGNLPDVTDSEDPKEEGKLSTQSAEDWQDWRDVTYLIDGDWQYYVNDDGSATITAYLGSDTDVITPLTVGGKNVTVIGTGTFENLYDLESVTISEGITQLGDIEFEDGYGGTYINGRVFTFAGVLTISFPSTLAVLGTQSFAYCWDLETITVAPGNPNFRIVDGVLYSGAGGANKVLECYPAQKTDISYVVLSGVEKIAPEAVCVNDYIKQITIPSSVAETYDGVYDCYYLETVNISEGVTSIGGFSFCWNLKNVSLPSTLIVVEESAFGICEKLTHITLPSGLKTIGAYAFSASGLTDVTIPALVEDIGPSAFSSCYDLSAINVVPSNTHYKSVDGVLFNKDGTWLIMYPVGKDGTSYTVPSGTKVITQDAFSDAGLTQVSLPDSLEGIWAGAFSYNNLTSIVIPQSMRYIGWRAFQDNQLTSVSIPKSVDFIGYGAFSYNPDLSNIIVYNDTVDYDSYDDVFYGSPKVVLFGNTGSTTQTYAQIYGLPFSPIPSSISLNTASATLLVGTTGKLNATTTPAGAKMTWSSDNTSVVSVDSDGNIKANAVGTATVTATSFDKSASCTVTVINLTPVGISCTKADATVYGAANGSVTVSASGGNSGRYEYSINGGSSWQGSGTFGGLAAGNYTAAVRDAGFPSNSVTQAVSVGQPTYMGAVAAKKIPSKVNAGNALTITPPVAPKGYTVQSITYSSSNPAVATVDASGTVTFLAGGKVTIITKVVSTTVDKKGKIKTKTTTVKKTITVKQPVASISLNLGNTTIARTQKVKLTPSIAPATASSKKVKWTTSNKKVATVSSSGVVTGKAGGTAVITCTAADGSRVVASCTVTVTPIYPTGVKMSKAALTVKTGKTASLKATVAPKNTDFKTVTWASSNAAVATVDAKGKIKGIAPGTAVITVTTSSGQTASCTVTVK